MKAEKPLFRKSEVVEFQKLLYASSNPTRRWLHCTRRDWIINAIRQCASNGRHGSALEIGFGSAIYLPVLAEIYDKVVASDVQLEYLNYANTLVDRYPNLILVADDIMHTELPQTAFDLVLCTEVIEHIFDSLSVFKTIRGLLKPGGTLILSTPQRWSPRELVAKIAVMPGIISLVRIIHREPVFDSGHINLMTHKQIASQLQEAGFRIRKCFESGMYLPVIAEFMGFTGLRMEKLLESKIRGVVRYWLLWTQYYIADA